MVASNCVRTATMANALPWGSDVHKRSAVPYLMVSAAGSLHYLETKPTASYIDNSMKARNETEAWKR